VSAGKFAFQADSNGEYWFAFRTTTLTGSVSPMDGLPQLRVLVDTHHPITTLSPQQSESGPLTPPRPMRFRDEQSPKQETLQQEQPMFIEMSPESKSIQRVTANEAVVNPEKPATTAPPAPPPPPATFMLGPRLPGFELPEEEHHDNDLLEDLLGNMSPFLDIQPVATKSIPSQPIATDQSNTTSSAPATSPVGSFAASTVVSPAVSPAASPAVSPGNSLPAGNITGISLDPTGAVPRIVVRWNTGHEPWQDAQIDILRSSTKDGQPSPIAINLPNNGEYWWFLTPEDLKPFHVVVRIRSFRGGIYTDVTGQAITINSQLPQ